MSSVEGLDELLATLSGLGGDIKESSRKGLERGAKRIQKNAKYLCPVRKPTKMKVKTKSGKTKKTAEGKVVWKVNNGGQLRNSIKTKSQATAEGVEAQVYTNLEYAPYVEFGTRRKRKNS